MKVVALCPELTPTIVARSFPPSSPSWFILTSSRLLDNILPRTSGFTGVRDVTSSRRILLNKREDERRRLAY